MIVIQSEQLKDQTTPLQLHLLNQQLPSRHKNPMYVGLSGSLTL